MSQQGSPTPSLLFLLISLLSLSFTQVSANTKKTILIDPGHGGNDPGSLGANRGRVIKEKDIALEIAKKVQRILYKDFNIYLTRSSDKYLSLKQRASLAQTIKADLFISIHLNSSKRRDYQGFETYYLDNNEGKALGKLEQEEREDKQKHGNNHKLTDVDKILMDLVIKKTVTYSKKLAHIIHNQVGRSLKPLGFRDRGVKAGLFYVLALSKTPGVLIEAGFLSNQKEMRKLLNEKNQDKLASGIASGIKEYFQ